MSIGSFRALAAVVALAALAVACGGDDKKDQQGAAPPAATPPAAAATTTVPSPVAAATTAPSPTAVVVATASPSPAAAATAPSPTPVAAATRTPAPAAAAATPSPAPAPAGPQVLTVRAMEQGNRYMYDPDTITVRAGTVVVTFTNEGPERPHTFNVRNLGGSGDLVRSGQVAVGQTRQVEFTVNQPGTYEFYCSLPGHADRGQRGTLTVTAS
jgi:plastocyanin